MVRFKSNKLQLKGEFVWDKEREYCKERCTTYIHTPTQRERERERGGGVHYYIHILLKTCSETICFLMQPFVIMECSMNKSLI